jgi:hypothetical protein
MLGKYSYHLNHSPSPFLFVCFQNRVSLTLPGLSSNFQSSCFQLPNCWDCRHAPLCPSLTGIFLHNYRAVFFVESASHIRDSFSKPFSYVLLVLTGQPLLIILLSLCQGSCNLSSVIHLGILRGIQSFSLL